MAEPDLKRARTLLKNDEDIKVAQLLLDTEPLTRINIMSYLSAEEIERVCSVNRKLAKWCQDYEVQIWTMIYNRNAPSLHGYDNIKIKTMIDTITTMTQRDVGYSFKHFVLSLIYVNNLLNKYGYDKYRLVSSLPGYDKLELIVLLDEEYEDGSFTLELDTRSIKDPYQHLDYRIIALSQYMLEMKLDIPNGAYILNVWNANDNQPFASPPGGDPGYDKNRLWSLKTTVSYDRGFQQLKFVGFLAGLMTKFGYRIVHDDITRGLVEYQICAKCGSDSPTKFVCADMCGSQYCSRLCGTRDAEHSCKQ